MDKLDENIEVLRIIMNKIRDSKKISWILTGSTSLALQGVDVKVNDIDILTDEDGAYELDKLLSEYCTKTLEYSSTDKYRSFFGKYKIDNIDIDIMGNFQYKLKTGEWSRLNNLNEVVMRNYKDMQIPTLTLEQELQEYENMDRKDKALKIKERLQEKVDTN